MRNNGNRAFRAALLAGGVIVLGSLGLAAGGALAVSLPPTPAPAGVTAADGQATTPMPAPHYGKNAAGQTYGLIASAAAASQSPDLVLVVATNGKQGYVTASDLATAEGTGFSSPQEALAWQAAQNGQSQSIPVYKSDGTTRIGDFTLEVTVGRAVNK